MFGLNVKLLPFTAYGLGRTMNPHALVGTGLACEVPGPDCEHNVLQREARPPRWRTRYQAPKSVVATGQVQEDVPLRHEG